MKGVIVFAACRKGKGKKALVGIHRRKRMRLHFPSSFPKDALARFSEKPTAMGSGVILHRRAW